jgi:transketolase
MNTIQKFLEHKAYRIRRWSLLMTGQAGSGHPTSCLSAADIVAALFFDTMHYDPDNFNNPNNDRFILSKGHASPLLYAAWHEAGKLSNEELMTYRMFGSQLEGHPTLRFAYTEAATGSLGIGLSIGLGMALNAKLDKLTYRTYVLLGDGEMAEGSVWEAVEIASYYKADNLVAIVDVNRLDQTGQTMYGHETQSYVDRFNACGWHAVAIDGHDMQHVIRTLEDAKKIIGKPVAIIAKTFKGHGVTFAEDKNGYHGKSFSKDDLNKALDELAKNFPQAAAYHDEHIWKPKLPNHHEAIAQLETKKNTSISMPQPKYNKEENLATRKAYGQALAALGNVAPHAISLDGEVKNSTFAEIFEHAHPERFFQCFIAEQNMVSMGVGFDLRGKIPFISSFGAFMTRAHDQIRMAAIGQSTIRLVGSHAGVSIGQDGPSQMALEDIAMMRALPESIVLYPSDAVSTYKLVEQMANYHDGISYLRTTRMDTPIHYNNTDEFPIGKCKVVRQSDHDSACVIGAGVTLFEAVKAYDQLANQEKPIHIAIIDLYSVKPLDTETLITLGKTSNNQIITVEDHYLQGGIGEAVSYALRNSGITITCLAVTKLPQSGKPEELLASAGIDAQAIVNAVKKINK